MKLVAHLKTALLVVGLLAARALHAADAVPAAGKPEARVAAAEAPGKQDIPEIRLPTDVELPETVKGLAAEFKSRAQSYVERQKEISKRAETATQGERDRLKEQLKENRAEFLQQTRQLRAELKERIKELQKSIGNSRPIDDGLTERGGRLRGGR
ncbi:MAG: hypothetical protein KF791_04570 [Verrucomicrobiae bacterium]|nr:hypothetical protein [Verrucomicrobiae bacterium]